MTPQQFEHIQQLFLRLRDMSPEQRSPILAQEDVSVRSELDSLLAAEEDCGTFLEQGVLRDSFASVTRQASPAMLDEKMPKPPKHVGPYRLLQQIGEGGYGTVFMAEQTEPIVRKVAIKLIKAGMDTKQVLARFHAERQALAMMNHPSIARVLDAGATETGSPFFVMELVKGIPIHDFCDQNHLDLNERLKLFLQVCRAVHHAHRKGVIHRDLKPSNVLVTMGEADPLAKVIDFGIAKALDNRLTDRTLFTEYGQMIGTLEYMSPEQAEMSAVDIDTRSDVYSLGVLLYQLLTGETPISKEQLLSKGLLEISRQIRDTDPATPSSRITKRHQQTAGPTSTAESTRRLMNLPSRDLDWITMKALAKDRRRRYDSALDFGRDVEKFLDGQPVHAHPPSVFYKFAKIARRHRIAAITTLLVVASALLGIAGLSVGLRRASESLRVAVERGEETLAAKQEADASARLLAKSMYTELLQSAWTATKTHDTDRAQELLDSCLPEMRGWEWRFANSRNRAEPHAVLREKGKAAITDIRLHRSSNLAACVLDDGDIEIWNTALDQLVHTIGNNCQANAAAFTTNGSELIVGTSKGAMTSFRVNDWKVIRTKSLGHGGIYSVDISKSDNQIAICTGGGYVELLDESFNTLDEWKISARAASVAMIDGTDQLIAAGLDGNAYQLEAGSPNTKDSFVSEASLQQIVPVGEHHVAVVSSGAAVKLNSADLEASPEELIRGTGMAYAIASNEAGTVYLGCGDGTLFSREPQELQQKIAEFNVAITALALHHDTILVALSDGRLLRLGTNNVIPGWTSITETPTTAGIFLSSHQLAVTLDDDGQMNVATLPSGENHKRIKAHQAAAWAIASDKNETILATVGEDQRLRCWELPSLELRFERAIAWGVRDVCVSPDGSWIAAAPPANEQPPQREGTIGIWDAKSGECIRLLKGHENWVLKMSPMPDGRQLVSSGENRQTRIWDVEQETATVISPEGKSPAIHHAFDSGQQQLYLGHRDGWVTSWDIQSGTAIASWAAFGDAITGLAVTNDNLVLATSRSSELLRIHDVTNATTVAEFDLGLGYLLNFQLSNDEKHLAATTQDREVLFTGCQ